MKYIQATCTYCNNKWAAINESDCTCDKCGDKKPKLEEKDTRSEIDYYQGSPPFLNEEQMSTSLKTPWYWDNSQPSKSSTLKDS